MKKPKIFACLASVLLLFGLCGCGSNTYEVGFGTVIGRLDNIMIAARSKNDKHPLNDINLELSYGGHVCDYPYGEDGEVLGVNIFICNSKYLRSLTDKNYYDDYYESRNLEELTGLYFYKFIGFDEFNSGEYNVEVGLFKGKVFTHSETVTVPSEVIEMNSGYFCFAFLETAYLKSKDKYCISMINYLVIGYERQANDIVRLTKFNDGGGMLTQHQDPK